MFGLMFAYIDPMLPYLKAMWAYVDPYAGLCLAYVDPSVGLCLALCWAYVPLG